MKIILRRLFTFLIWLTLFITCSVSYVCHQIPMWNRQTDRQRFKKLVTGFKMFYPDRAIIWTKENKLNRGPGRVALKPRSRPLTVPTKLDHFKQIFVLIRRSSFVRTINTSRRTIQDRVGSTTINTTLYGNVRSYMVLQSLALKLDFSIQLNNENFS